MKDPIAWAHWCLDEVWERRRVLAPDLGISMVSVMLLTWSSGTILVMWLVFVRWMVFIRFHSVHPAWWSPRAPGPQPIATAVGAQDNGAVPVGAQHAGAVGCEAL